VDVVQVLWLDLSVVTNSSLGGSSITVDSAFTFSVELTNELVKVMLFHWVNCADLIPEHLLGTWWGGHRSLVDPSVIEVNHVDELSIWDIFSDVLTLFIPVH